MRTHLQAVSRPFGDLATQIVETLPRNPERTVALRKLLVRLDEDPRPVVTVDAPEACEPPPDLCPAVSR